RTLAEAFGPGARAFPSFETLRDDPAGLSALPAGARILVKGSLFWAAARVVGWLLDRRSSSGPVRSGEILA
ncbi:MAG TPA: hypothetical protein VN436_17990, partial [Holophaga sp.]|nr:hypothetical protein [Holophaga sp.]